MIDLAGGEARIPLRVAMVTRYPPSWSGGAPAAADLAHTMEGAYGIDVEVLRLVDPLDAPSPGPPVVMELNPHWRLSGLEAARRASRSDLVVVRLESGCPVAFLSELIDHSSVPIVLSLDELPRDRSPRLGEVAVLASRVAGVVVPSHAARERLAARSSESLEAAVIPHGSPWPALAPKPPPRRRILTWGSLGPDIGAERVVRALPLLGDLDPPVRYRLVGVAHPAWSSVASAAYRKALQNAARDAKIAESVEFGAMLHSRRGLLAEIEQCDVVAVVYDPDDRTASRIITEAIGAGRPVVATAFPGAVELLSSGAGITVPDDDPTALAGALRLLLTDEDAYRGAVDAATSLRASLEWGSVTSRLVALLVQVASRRQPSSRLTPGDPRPIR